MPLVLKPKDKQIIINMATSWLPILIGAVVFFFLTPYMRIKLGDDMLGIWYLISGLQIYLAIGHSSTNTGLTKYVAEYLAKNDTEHLNTIISTGLTQYFLFALAAALAAPAIVMLANLLPAMHAADQFHAAQLTLILLIINFIINTPLCGMQSIIAGFQRYDFNNAVSLLQILLHAAGTFILLFMGYGIVQLAIWQFIITGILYVIIFVFLKGLHPHLFEKKYIRWPAMKQLFRFNIHTFIIALNSLLFFHADNIVIGAMYSGAAITYYALGYKIILQLQQIGNPVIGVLLPVASEISILQPEERRQKLEELFTRGSRFAAILTLPFILFIIILGPEFIQIWQGPRYAHTSETYYVLMILILPYAFAICQHIGVTMLYGLALHHVMTAQWVIASIMNLLLSILLGWYWGIYGVALGTAAPLLVIQIIMQYRYKIAFDISLARYYRNVGAKLIPITFLAAIALTACKFTLHFSRLHQILIPAALLCTGFWMLSFRALDPYERQVLRHLIGKVFKLHSNAK